MNTEKSMIWVSFQKEGIHCYPAAATIPALDDVKFLSYPHRHIFHFKVWIEVFHDDRDIEFIQFKRWLEACYTNGTLELNYKSCEMIARELHSRITSEFPIREVWISVSEDNENGCFIKFPSSL